MTWIVIVILTYYVTLNRVKGLIESQQNSLLRVGFLCGSHRALPRRPFEIQR